MIMEKICCKICGCNVFVLKSANKKPNKKGEEAFFLDCLACNYRLKFDKSIKKVGIEAINKRINNKKNEKLQV